jgi:hypothetical protein
VQVSVRASVRSALQRSGAVVLGVLLAIALGDAISLNGLTVALLILVSLGVTQLLLRLPSQAARQVPVTFLVVLTTVTASQEQFGWERALEAILGAVVGVGVSLVMPASRVVDATQTLRRLGDGLGDVLDAMGTGVRAAWSTEQTENWRRSARVARDRLVDQAVEAIGSGREVARWNVRDRRHVATLARYERALPRLERTAIGVWVIARGLDSHARLAVEAPPRMPMIGSVLTALAAAVRGVVDELLGGHADVGALLDEVSALREHSTGRAAGWARTPHEHAEGPDGLRVEADWLSYAALLVQVDRIIVDLRAELPR